jgi:hypothetical protein
LLRVLGIVICLVVVTSRLIADESRTATDDQRDQKGAKEAPAAESDEEQESAKPKYGSSKPTHKQSALININADGLADASTQCFCLTSEGNLLAGCSGAAKEIRVFDADGQYVNSIELTVSPEAINVAPDGTILVAGEGKCLRLSSDGEVITEADSPHADAIRERKDEIRKEVIEQHKQQFQMLPQMLESYDVAIKEAEKQIDALKSQEDAQAQLDTLKETLKAYEEAKDQLKEQYGAQADESNELTEEQIADSVKASMQYKIKVASISSDGDAVFVACGMPAGYGYEVWKLSPDFTEGKSIVSGLSGCCGQMDVQANQDGVFIAENSRKRVRRLDAEGKSICDWGKSSESVGGFGSCCNPMNLAFGADGAVYTAEDTTGRIKRYSSDGKLLSVVGSADVVPGCKKVSIGVDATGDRVYMLDITKNNVAVLTRVSPDPTEPLNEEEGGSIGGKLLRAIFGS